MKEIRIGRGTQMALLAVLGAGAVAAAAMQAPDIKRYIKMEKM